MVTMSIAKTYVTVTTKRKVGTKNPLVFAPFLGVLHLFMSLVLVLVLALASLVRAVSGTDETKMMIGVGAPVPVPVTDVVRTGLSNDDTNSSCSVTQTPFRLELETTGGQYPNETSSWEELIDANINGMVISVDPGTYNAPGAFYNVTFCLETMSCHQFTIKDTNNNDGIFYDGVVSTGGLYKIFYDDRLIIEGNDFGKFDTSILVGDVCPSTPSSSSSMTLYQTKTTASQLICPAGMLYRITHENGIESCLPCLPGTYNDKPGIYDCMQCPSGTFQDNYGKTSCFPCKEGTYADDSGSKRCINCPPRTSSMKGSIICPFCDYGYYLYMGDHRPINYTHAWQYDQESDTIIAVVFNYPRAQTIMQDPLEYCKECPEGGICPANTTILDIVVPPHYWRWSIETDEIYGCERSNACIGTQIPTIGSGIGTQIPTIGSGIGTQIPTKYRNKETGIYCKEGHTGPLCEVCVNDDYYLDNTEKRCVECPRQHHLAIQLAYIFSGAAILFIIATWLMRKVPSFLDIVSSVSLQAKAKLFISFYQLLSSFEPIYGVKLEFYSLKILFKYITFDFLDILNIPMSCIASFQQQLIINAVWPFVVILVGALIVLISRRIQDNGKDVTSSYFQTSKKWIIQWVIIVFQVALPAVSQKMTLDWVRCREFGQYIDENGSWVFLHYSAYDMSLECDSAEYTTIRTTFWTVFVIWTIVVPLVFITLLRYVRQSVQSNIITPLANACRFLWQDYEPSIWYWDAVDMLRKLFLTCFITIIDPSHDLRVVVAIIVSVFYHSFLLAFRPYKRNDDYYLAFVSNLLLICCFALGTIPQLIYFIANGGSNLFLLIALGMLAITICLIIALAVNKIRAPTVQMNSTGNAPNLELPQHCSFHVFMSHVWATGQARTHAIARKMQLLLPGLKVWLDVDELNDISKLEEWVEASAVFILFYSKNYFRSKNCRREIYAAIKFDKPIVLLYEGSPSVIEEMKAECLQYCEGNGDDLPTAACILQKLLGDNQDDDILSESTNGPIQWLDEGSFSAASLNQIYYRVISQLPFYKSYQNELEKGIQVPDELGLVSLQSPISLLVYENNQGCSGVVEELKSMLPQGSSGLISVANAAVTVNTMIKREEDQVEDIDNNIEVNGREEVEYTLSMPYTSSHTPTYFLLYLNQYTFHGNEQELNELTTIVQSCIDNPDINIVLVHEKDVSQGGCNFDIFLNEAPEELINPPYTLFNNLAIPLYSYKEYRDVSLKQILCKMGAKQIANTRRARLLRKSNIFFNSFVGNIRSMIRQRNSR